MKKLKRVSTISYTIAVHEKEQVFPSSYANASGTSGAGGMLMIEMQSQPIKFFNCFRQGGVTGRRQSTAAPQRKTLISVAFQCGQGGDRKVNLEPLV